MSAVVTPKDAAPASSNKTPAILDAIFPSDLPSKDNEECFLSILCEEQNMRWALYHGGNFQPSHVWTTPYLEHSEKLMQSCLTLNRFLPDQACTYVFGGEDIISSTSKNAARMASMRNVPALSVYILVITPNTADGAEMVEQQEHDIAFLFQDVPSRLLRLKSSNFFPQKPRLPLLTSGRAAALYAAMDQHKTAILLVDAGRTTTYLAADRNGRVLGGGVGMGFNMRLAALSDYCDVVQYPTISFDDVRKILQKSMEQRDGALPVPLISPDAATSMIGSATSEIAVQMRNLANQFLDKIKQGEGSKGNGSLPATFVVMGDDGAFVASLLSLDCAKAVYPEPDVKFPTADQIKLVVEKNLVPSGISALFQKSSLSACDDHAEKLRKQMLGLRGAKAESLMVDDKPKSDIYRGTIVRVIRGKTVEDDFYEIVYDNDGEKVLLNVVEVFDALTLYEEVGEGSEEAKHRYFNTTKQLNSKTVRETLVQTSMKTSERKAALDAMRESEGSVVGILGNHAVGKRGKKRVRAAGAELDDPEELVNKRVAKWFGDLLFFGTIEYFDEGEKWWHVIYDDDDQEDFDSKQVRTALALYEQNKKSDPKKKNRT